MINEKNIADFPAFSLYRPVHSDFIVHWSGKDIDDNCHSDWYNYPSSETDDCVTAQYVQRFKDILFNGLWMTTGGNEKITVNGTQYQKPAISRTCFTELRLSDSRLHAKKFGRLGFGFKRMFLFDRLGRPVIYHFEGRPNILFNPYTSIDLNNEKEILCFLKPICSRVKYKEKNQNKSTLVYDFFDEFEWRIIYSDAIGSKDTSLQKYFINPQTTSDNDIKNYYSSITSPKKPDFLIPLGSWLSLIIFPSLDVKEEIISDISVQKKLLEIKNSEGIMVRERKNFPVCLDLDACRNF